VIKVLLVLISWLIAFILILSSCKPSTTTELSDEEKIALVKEIKAFQKKIGFSATENFASYSDEKEAYHYYFYTPVIELPYSLDDPSLKNGEGTPQTVSLDAAKYDVYFYSIPALAGVRTPVTKSLLESPLYRFIFVIFHEDWHEQISLPLGIEEPSGEIVSYVASLLFTEKRFGRNSGVYKNLEWELNHKLKESRVFQSYYSTLTALYADYHAGKISEAEALSHKDKLIQSMNHDIYNIWGERRDQLNNAFIAFQMTYYRYLNLMYDVFSASNSDITATIKVLRAMPEQGVKFDNDVEQVKTIEGRVAEYLRNNCQTKP